MLAVVVLYCWTATIGVADRNGIYNRLGEAFAHGQVALLEKPSPQLLRLPDPYDPMANERFRTLDLSLYGGRYYAYWGPVPALLIFAPAHLAGLGDVSERLVTLACCLVLFGLSVLSFQEVLRRWSPDAPGWARLVGIGLLGMAGAELWLLETPKVYGLSIAAGAAFLMAAILMVLRGFPGRGVTRLAWLAGGSLCVGLAVGCRWTLAPALVVPLVIAGWSWRRTEPSSRRSMAAALLVPVSLCASLLLAYNAARFGSPLETGLRYQLANRNYLEHGIVGSPALAGLSYYFLRPFEVALKFPYLWLLHRATPAYSVYIDDATGMLWTSPALLAVPVAIVSLKRRAPVLAACVSALVGLAAVIFAQHLFFRAAALRFQGDFAPLLALGAAIACAGLASFPGRRKVITKATKASLVAASVVGAIVTVLLSLDKLAATQPTLLTRMGERFAFIPEAASRLVGHPLLVDVDGGIPSGRAPFVWGPGQRHDVTVVSAHAGVARLSMGLRRTSTDRSEFVVRATDPTGRSRTSGPASTGQAVVRVPLSLEPGLTTMQMEVVSVSSRHGNSTPIVIDRLDVKSVPG